MSFLIIGLSTQSYAAKGYANDGLAFMMVVPERCYYWQACFPTIDFLKRRGRTFGSLYRMRVRKHSQLSLAISTGGCRQFRFATFIGLS